MKLKTLITVPLIIVALVYAGAKGYIYYKVKTGLDKMIALAAPVVQIDYSGIGSELTGSIQIENVRITPTGTYNQLTIQQIEIAGDGYKFLFALARGFDNREIPAQMTISFTKLEMPTTSPFLSNLTSYIAKDGNKKRLVACTIPGILNAVGLKELDTDSISITGSMGYVFDQDAEQAEYHLRYDLAGVESSSLEMRLSQLSAAGMMGLGQLPIIEELRMVRQFNNKYMQQMIKHCATTANLSTRAFIDDLFTQSDDYYLKTLGFIPGPGLSELFRQLITNAGTVEIRATPSSEISPGILNAYRPEDLVDLFGVTASYNDNPITDLSFSVQPSSPRQKAEPPANASREEISTPVAPAVKTIRKKPKSRFLYLDTDVSDLSNYINYRIRVYTLNNNLPKRGILVSINNNTLNIEQLIFNGKMTSHVNLGDIDKVEVLRREEEKLQ